MDSVNVYLEKAVEIGADIGVKILGALALWIIGKWLIRFVLGVTRRAMDREKLDATLVRYVNSALGVLLNIILVIAVLSLFGVETTTFAGLLAAAGVAIGMAWSGLLGNFAAGIFMIILRPFKVGDFVSVAGMLGTVREIGLFVTALDTMDNVRTYLGNGKIFGDTIQNFHANAFRRVDLKAQLAHGVDHADAIRRLEATVKAIPGVQADPAPVLEILDFTLAGPVLAVRPFCGQDAYWDVYFATNRAIRETFGDAGYPVPEQHFQVATRAA